MIYQYLYRFAWKAKNKVVKTTIYKMKIFVSDK